MADSAWHARANRTLTAIFFVAVAVSVVHYSDNYFNYHDYPRSGTLPNPSAALVGLAWFGFTAAGLLGWLEFRREPTDRSLVLLAFYSGSGLVGFLHYSVAGATHMPWWRQAHIVSDIACGLAMFGFVLWASSRRRGAEVSASMP